MGDHPEQDAERPGRDVEDGECPVDPIDIAMDLVSGPKTVAGADGTATMHSPAELMDLDKYMRRMRGMGGGVSAARGGPLRGGGAVHN